MERGVAAGRAGRLVELAKSTVPDRFDVEGVGAEIATLP